MTSIIEVKDAQITDEWGAVHPQALAAINSIGANLSEVEEADFETGQYKETLTYERLFYSVSYYVSPLTKQKGYDMKPLSYRSTEGNVETIFEVDTDNPRYSAILASNDPLKKHKVITMHFREAGSKFNIK